MAIASKPITVATIAKTVAISGFVGGIAAEVNGGTFAEGFKAGVVGSVFGIGAGYAASAVSATLVGEIIIHGIASGMAADINGGTFASGFLAGSAGVVGGHITSAAKNIDPSFGFVSTVVVGGTISELTGGKFVNGGTTAAFGYLMAAGSRQSRYGDDGLLKDEYAWKILKNSPRAGGVYLDYVEPYLAGIGSLYVGVGRAIRFTGRGLGFYGEREYAYWRAEGAVMDIALDAYVNNQWFRNQVNDRIAEYAGSQNKYYINSRFSWGIVASPVGTLATIGDFTHGAEIAIKAGIDVTAPDGFSDAVIIGMFGYK
ncbi:MAG: hypothetical protein ACWA5Q_00090 [bacterium]